MSTTARTLPLPTAAELRAALTCGKPGCPCMRPGPNGKTHCPAHADDAPSLDIVERDGRTLLVCRAGCPQDAVLAALRARGLWPERQNGHRPGPGQDRETRYELYDSDGRLVAVHCRIDTPHGKVMWWEQPDGARGLGGRKAAGLPLYGIHALNGATDVVVTEGEKAAAALQALGIPAVGTVTGAGGTPSDAALTPLLGRHRVFLWADNDGPGREHMRRIAQRLIALGADPKQVRWVEWEAAPAGGDAADFVVAGGDAGGVELLLLDAVPVPSLPATGAAPGTADSTVSTDIRPGPPVESNSTSRAAFRFRPPAALLSATPEQVPWLWQGYLARGALTVLGAREKAGKSTLTWALVAALLSGRDFCGQPTTPTPVVVLTEEPPPTVAEKLERFGIAPDAPLSILTRADVRGRPDWEAVVAAAGAEAARLSAGLVVVDTLAYWAALPPDAENSAGAMTAALRPLLELAGQGLAVLAVHHANKADGELRGSTAIGAAADIIVTLAREAEAPTRRRLEAIGRFGDCPTEPVVIELSGDGYVALGSPREVSAEAREQQVLGAVPSAPPGLTQREVAAATGLPQQRVAEALAALARRGAVTRAGQGTRGDPYRYWRPTGGVARGDGEGRFDSTAGPGFLSVETGASSASDALAPAAPAARDSQALSSGLAGLAGLAAAHAAGGAEGAEFDSTAAPGFLSVETVETGAAGGFDSTADTSLRTVESVAFATSDEHLRAEHRRAVAPAASGTPVASEGGPCPRCGYQLVERTCWKCKDSICRGCGHWTGSDIRKRCIPCGLKLDQRLRAQEREQEREQEGQKQPERGGDTP